MGGVPFLRALYKRCTTSPNVQPVTLGSFLDQHPPRDTLPRLFAGSWINHDFAIWIGHDEDNTAWDLLHRAREFLKSKETEGDHQGDSQSRSHTRLALAPSVFEKAWKELYIAEGSDWFWWYGEEHTNAQLDVFDYLFRKHLQNVYLLLGDTPPAELSQPISRRSFRALYTVPRAFLDVKIDGRLTFFEWIGSGRYTCQNERGTMALVTPGPIQDLYFGFDLENLLIRVDFDGPARTALIDYDNLRIGFLEPAGWEARIVPGPRGWGVSSASIELWHHESIVQAIGLAVGVDQIVEACIPFEALELKPTQPLQFFVELCQEAQSRDRAPREEPIQLLVPSADYELIMWDV
jgi:hypothetical protein